MDVPLSAPLRGLRVFGQGVSRPVALALGLPGEQSQDSITGINSENSSVCVAAKWRRRRSGVE